MNVHEELHNGPREQHMCAHCHHHFICLFFSVSSVPYVGLKLNPEIKSPMLYQQNQPGTPAFITLDVQIHSFSFQS